MTERVLLCRSSSVAAVYDAMRRDGIPPAEIDRDDDGLLTCGEVLEAALERAGRYASQLEKITGRPVPWVVGDSTKKAMRRVVKMVRDRLERQGFEPGSDEYVRRMADALYAFAQMYSGEDHKSLKRHNPPLFRRILASIKRLGFDELVREMETKGGLGLSGFSKDAPVEATAQEALDIRMGACTERSKVIYALFEEAGLEPFFGVMTGEQFLDWHAEGWIETGERRPFDPAVYLTGHQFVGVQLSDRVRYYEPNFYLPGSGFGERARRMSLREAYQSDLTNLALDYVGQGGVYGLERARTALDGAKSLGDTSLNSLIMIVEAMIFLGMGDEVAAADLIRQVAGTDSFLVEGARLSLCDNHISKYELQEALSCLESVSDGLPQKHLMMAQIADLEGRADDFRDKMARAVSLGADPHKADYDTGVAYLKVKRPDDAEPYLRRAMKHLPSARLPLAGILLDSGRAQEAVNVLGPYVALNSASAEALAVMAKAQARSGDSRAAVLYFKRCLAVILTERKMTYQTYRCSAGLAHELGMVGIAETVASSVASSGHGGHEAVFRIDLVSRSRERLPEALALYREFLAGARHDRFEEIAPAVLYQDLSAISERVGMWGELAKFCMRAMVDSPFQVYALHAAMKSGRHSVAAEAMEGFHENLDGLFSLGVKGLRADGMQNMCAAIDSMPVDFLREGALSFRLGRPFHLRAMILEHHGRPLDAVLYYQRAFSLGERDPEILEAIERLEKAISVSAR